MNKLILTALLFLFCASYLPAQSPWTLASTIQGNNFYNVCAVTKDKVVASAEWGMLFQSNDGGNNLQAYQLTNNYSLFYDVEFRNPQEGYAGGGCYFPTAECVVNVMASTTDGGLNWAWEQVAPGLGVLIKLSVLSDGTVFALGDYGGLYRRLPLSQSWDSLGMPDSQHAGTYTNVQFLDDNHGFVELWSYQPIQNENHLLRTDDGGQHWTEIATVPNQGQRPIYYFIDPEHGFQTTYTGQLSRTVDGGNTWVAEQLFAPTEYITKMDIVNANVVYLSTYDAPAQIGRIYRSNDGGAQWNLDFQADSIYIQDIDFSDPEHGYALSSYRQIYRRMGSVPTFNPNDETNFSIQPNPVHDFAAISVPEGYQGSALKVFDVLGRELQRIQLPEGQKEITFVARGLSPGLYFLALEGGGAEPLRFVVE